METVSPMEAKAKRWSGHMVSLLCTKSRRACLTASIRLTTGRGPGCGGGGGDAVEAEPEDGAEAADFISALASRSTSTQKRMSSAGRRTGGSE
jgi:hypothetical protein